MAINPFIAAINQLVDEKNLPKEVVVEALESAIAAAYRKEYGKPNQIIKVSLNPDNNKMRVWQVFDVVEDEELTEPENQKNLLEAQEINKDAKIGETVEIELEAKHEFGRIAAQTAKQVIIQRLREAERNLILDEFKTKEDTVMNATIQQIEGENIIINLGRASGVMPSGEQIPGERYYIGQRLKVYIAEVDDSQRGLHILLSRARAEFIKTLFTAEVPEIANGTVEIKAITREAGSRTKMAVYTDQEGLDPVGSCVGQRGTRVQAVLAEIGEEKIDIILWNDEIKQFIINALSPAKISNITLNKDERKAMIDVDPDQLSLAIGKNGQNVRLASKLTGWSIDIAKDAQEDKGSKAVSEETKTSQKETAQSTNDETPEITPTESDKTAEITVEETPVNDSAQIIQENPEKQASSKTKEKPKKSTKTKKEPAQKVENN